MLKVVSMHKRGTLRHACARSRHALARTFLLARVSISHIRNVVPGSRTFLTPFHRRWHFNPSHDPNVLCFLYISYFCDGYFAYPYAAFALSIPFCFWSDAISHSPSLILNLYLPQCDIHFWPSLLRVCIGGLLPLPGPFSNSLFALPFTP